MSESRRTASDRERGKSLAAPHARLNRIRGRMSSARGWGYRSHGLHQSRGAASSFDTLTDRAHQRGSRGHDLAPTQPVITSACIGHDAPGLPDEDRPRCDIERRQVQLYRRTLYLPADSLVKQVICTLDGEPIEWNLRRKRGSPRLMYSGHTNKFVLMHVLNDWNPLVLFVFVCIFNAV